MSAQWHYIKDREQVGPVTEDRLTELAVSKRLLPCDQVWREGMSGWAKAGDALPALFPQEPPPLPSESSRGATGLVGRALRLVLDKEWQEFLDDAWKAWRASSALKKSLVILTVLAVLSITLWVWIARATSPSGEELGLWSRLWDGSLIVSLAGLVVKMLAKLADRPTDTKTRSDEMGPPSIVEGAGSGVLGLSGRQWLVILVAFFIPMLLVSLVSSFLVGSQVHLWVSGPMLCLSGLAISAVCVQLAKADKQANLAGWGIVGASAVLLYALTCINTRWVLLFYTLAVIVPALHLFTLAHRGAPAITFKAPLMAAFGVVGLVIFLGIAALPRSVADRDDSAKLVGTWAKGGKTLTFTQGGTVTVEGGYSEWVAKFKFDGTTLTIFDDKFHRDGTRYQVELVSDSSLLFGADDNRNGLFGEFSVLKGCWSKQDVAKASGKNKAGSKTGDPKPGPKDPTDTEPPKLDSPLAPKLVGKWQGVGAKTKGHLVEFTKAGKVEFTYPDSLRKGEMETILGGYSFKKEALLQLDRAGAFTNDDGWRIEVEFPNDDEVFFVNHGHPFGGFGPLAGRYKRVK